MSQGCSSGGNESTTGVNVPEEEEPLLVRLFNHILTPGSALSPIIWISFNIIMVMLGLIWAMFVYSMPDNIHVWAFGFLGFGLFLSTNWLMKIVFSAGLDYDSQKASESAKKDD